jgi:hypothetical protein
MVRTESYVPKKNIFGLDAGMFERYFGCKAVGTEEPCGGDSVVCAAIKFCLKGAARPRSLWLFVLPTALGHHHIFPYAVLI